MPVTYNQTIKSGYEILWIRTKGMKNEDEATLSISFRPPGLEKDKNEKFQDQIS